MTQEGEITTLERRATYKEAQEVLQSANTAVYLALLPVAGRLGADLAAIHERFGRWVVAMTRHAAHPDSPVKPDQPPS